MDKVTQKMKSERGVTLVALVAMLIIVFTILSVVLYNGRTSIKLDKLNDMYSDISTLEEKVQLYYIKNGILPTKGNAQEFSAKDLNPNDEEAAYYSIDLGLLGDIELENSINDYYINQTSLTVYSINGYEYEGVTYHTIPRKYAIVDLNEEDLKEYTIKINENKKNKTNVYDKNYFGKYELPYLEPYEYQNTRYYFDGWLANDGTYYRYAYRGLPKEVTAQWTTSKTNVEIHFYDENNQVDVKVYSLGEKFGELPSLSSSEEKRFVGWVNTAGEIITKDMIVTTKDKKLTAKWELQSNAIYTIIFEPLNGTVDVAYKNVQNNTQYGELPEAIPNDSEYIFEGWYLDRYFINRITPETIVSLDKDTTVYANYIKRNITVTFDFNRPDDVSLVETKEYENGLAYGELPRHDNITIKEENSEESIYMLIGWSTIQNGDINIIPEDIVKLYDDTTLYGVWIKVN